MPVTVKIGQRLSEYTDGETVFTVEGATLGQLIHEIDTLHPGFRGKILTGAAVVDWIQVRGDRGETILSLSGQPVADGALLSIAMTLPGG